jgi:hypothetical protein
LLQVPPTQVFYPELEYLEYKDDNDMKKHHRTIRNKPEVRGT